ncbi:pilus assembly FimT family protein [Pirellulimonas nuda]|nr:type II secretion system protein [Pirellulimonas nuda]
MTLVELLVVMVIITTLVAAAIPLLSPPGDERVIREAARGVNTFLAGAQSRAIETGRPFGVALKKLSQDTGRLEDSAVCLEMYYVQQPAPYSGFDDAARVRIALDVDNSGAFYANQPYQVRIQFVRLESSGAANLPSGVSYEIMPDSFFGPGDVIVIDGAEFVFIDDNGNEGGLDSRGRYPATAGFPDGTLLARGPTNIHSAFSFVYDNQGVRVSVPPNPSLPPLEYPYWTEPLRFKLLRQPAPTSNQPYQLPTGAAIDLRASGFTVRIAGNATNATVTNGEFAKPDLDTGTASQVNNPIENNNPVYLMFSPEGSVERVTYDLGASAWDTSGVPINNYSANPFSEPVTDNVHLLIGMRENSPAPWVDFTAFTGTEQDLASAKAKINWLNLNSEWVVIGAQTGAVTTVPNAAVNPTAINSSLSPLARRATEINAARALVRESAKAGGR